MHQVLAWNSANIYIALWCKMSVKFHRFYILCLVPELGLILHSTGRRSTQQHSGLIRLVTCWDVRAGISLPDMLAYHPLICQQINSWYARRLGVSMPEFLKVAILKSHNCGEYMRTCANFGLMNAKQDKLAHISCICNNLNFSLSASFTYIYVMFSAQFI